MAYDCISVWSTAYCNTTTSYCCYYNNGLPHLSVDVVALVCDCTWRICDRRRQRQEMEQQRATKKPTVIYSWKFAISIVFKPPQCRRAVSIHCCSLDILHCLTCGLQHYQQLLCWVGSFSHSVSYLL